MKKLGLFIVFFGLLTSCTKEDALTIVYPKEYLPAYPGSWWVYSNGERVTVQPEYVAHSYQPSINSNDYTSEKLVPCIDGNYLYEYSITQYSTLYPIKKLLEESVSQKPWIVNEVNGEIIYRQTIKKLDSMYIYKPSFGTPVVDTLFKSVLVVVEFSDTLTAAKWNTKEYYAKNVGLICTEINNPFDTLNPVIQKVIIDYYINY